MLTDKNEFVKLHRQMWTSIADYIHDEKRVVNIDRCKVIWLRKMWVPYHKSIPSAGYFAWAIEDGGHYYFCLIFYNEQQVFEV